MRLGSRKSAPNVKSGRVQRQNNWDLTGNYYNVEQTALAFDRQRPGKGYRHILKQQEIIDFISILPNWDEMSKGLNGIVQCPKRPEAFGYYVPCVIHLCAWEIDYWIHVPKHFYEDKEEFLNRIKVPCEVDGDRVLCKFNRNTARAHQLLRTFLHELGHHHDSMTSKSKDNANRGESYAEEYAKKYQAQIWTRYQDLFEV